MGRRVGASCLSTNHHERRSRFVIEHKFPFQSHRRIGAPPGFASMMGKRVSSLWYLLVSLPVKQIFIVLLLTKNVFFDEIVSALDNVYFCLLDTFELINSIIIIQNSFQNRQEN